MKKILSGQRILRGLLIALIFFMLVIKDEKQSENAETLFCYTRDGCGNKALIKDNGAVCVEDVFVMEIPSGEWNCNGSVTLTVIVEDQEGNRKTKKLRLYEKKP